MSVLEIELPGALDAVSAARPSWALRSSSIGDSGPILTDALLSQLLEMSRSPPSETHVKNREGCFWISRKYQRAGILLWVERFDCLLSGARCAAVLANAAQMEWEGVDYMEWVRGRKRGGGEEDGGPLLADTAAGGTWRKNAGRAVLAALRDVAGRAVPGGGGGDAAA